MREIKFRAWHNVDWVMYYNHSVSISISGSVFYLERVGEWVEDEDKSMITLMQFTGLHDKNGKEIYEGDIVDSHSNFDKPYIREVIYGENCGLEFKPLTGFNLCKSNERHFEVIGNIYEHEYLLNENKISK